MPAAETPMCECEMPGYFYSGVPGIIARVQNGYLVSGAAVERCDLCERYASDDAAKFELRRRGTALPWWKSWINRIVSLK